MPGQPASTPLEPDAPRRRYAPRMPPQQRREQLIDAALEVILELGYRGVSIEAVARAAGVTRPVVYDHFPNLGRLLYELVAREERYSLKQLEKVVPSNPGDADPVDVLASGVSTFLEAVRNRPATWRLILLPLEGTPEIVRDHVERNRERILKRIERLVEWAIVRNRLPADLDVELAARAIRDLGEQAGRMVLTDPTRHTPARYGAFVRGVLALLPSSDRDRVARTLQRAP
jgi:AcrR family transcriptional regulator